MAQRILFRSRKQRYFSWASSLSILGLSLSIAVLITTLSVLDGFEQELFRQISISTPNISLSHRGQQPIYNWQALKQEISADHPAEILSISPVVNLYTLIRHQSLEAGLHLQGTTSKPTLVPLVRPASACKELDQPSKEPNIILGQGLASLIEAKQGDTVQVIWPAHTKHSFEKHPSDKITASLGHKKFKVAGIYQSGLGQVDNQTAFTSLANAQQFMNFGQGVHGLEIELSLPQKSKLITDHLIKKDSFNYQVQDWQTVHEGLYQAIKNERSLVWMIIFVVSAICGVNILTTLFILVTQCQKEIATLKSLGCNQFTLVSIFLKQAGIIGSIGAALGVLLAFCFGQFIEAASLFQLPEVYLVKQLPVAYEISTYLSVTLFAVLLAIISGIAPAYRASQMSACNGLITRRSG